jgi:hypothetical protein
VETGHAPELMLDIRSGRPLADAAVYGFWPGVGGFSAETTPPGLTADDLQTVWKVRRRPCTFSAFSTRPRKPMSTRSDCAMQVAARLLPLDLWR